MNSYRIVKLTSQLLAAENPGHVSDGQGKSECIFLEDLWHRVQVPSWSCFDATFLTQNYSEQCGCNSH